MQNLLICPVCVSLKSIIAYRNRPNRTPINRCAKLGCALATIVLLAQTLASAVTFTISPNTVSNTYVGYITFQINGLTNGETVLLQRYLDVNASGTIDAGDILSGQFQLTDGQRTVIGGITNINVPGDTTGVDGAITAKVNFAGTDPSQSMIGKRLFRLSSPGGHFAPLTASLTVNNTAYGQSFTGHVQNNGTNVANAGVLLFNPGGGGLNLVAATLADSTGVFTIKAAPGTYALAAFKSNYVADASAAAGLTLAPGATVTTNISLISATASISGAVQDANSSAGLPGIFVLLSANNVIAISSSDPNGSFKAPVTANQWKVQPDGQQLTAYGYLRGGNPRADTSTGSVANVTLSLPKANALIYGSIKDNLNIGLAGVQLSAQDNNGNYKDDGLYSDASGNYVAGALGGGTWDVEISNDGNPAFTNYVFSTSPFTQNNNNGSGTNLIIGQAVQANFTALFATSHINGSIKDGNNIPLPNINVSAFASGLAGGLDFQSQANSDANGNFSLPVVNGTWSVNVCCGCNSGSCNNCLSSSYCCQGLNQQVSISGADGSAQFVATQSGQVAISTPSQLPGGQVGVFYDQFLQASSCAGNFTWTALSALPGWLQLNGGNGELSGTPTVSGTNTFTLQVTDGNNTSTSQSFSLVVSPGIGCTLICPNNISVPASQGQCGAVVTYSQPSTAGNCGTTTCAPASGSFFPVGITTVNCTNDAGANCSFTVTVNETQAPVISCPSNLTLASNPGQCSRANVTFTVNATNSCGSVPVVSTPPSGSTFPIGVTTVTNTASNGFGTTSTCTFTVTISGNLTLPPVINCPGNLTFTADPGQCGKTNVTFSVSATNQCGGPVPVVSVPPSGSSFPFGLTTVTNTATDSAGNSNSCIFTVTVTDTQQPIITCPNNLVLAADPGQCSRSNVSFTVTANDNCGPANVISIPPSGSTFSVGVHTVTNTATDSHTNTSQCTFTVTVLDNQPPVMTCSSNLVLAADPGSCSRSNVTFSVTAFDNCDGAVSVVSLPPSGSTFPRGVTTVSSTAHDSHGNTNLCSFTVTITDSELPVVALYGSAVLTNECHTPFTDPGATASDNCSSTLPVTTNSTVNANATGSYTITYVTTDSSGNSATNTRQVFVVDTTPPVVTVLGQNPIDVLTNTIFTDPGATAHDVCAGVLAVSTNGIVDVTTAGSYTIAYTATDPSGNSATNTRVVNVLTNLLPVFVNQPTDVTTNAGSVVALSVTAAGFNLSYQWCKNGQPLGDSNNVSGSATSTLTLSNVLRADDGTYLVKVSDSLGTTNSDPATVTVIDPFILSGPADQSTFSGGTASFGVTASGTPPLAYQWYSAIGLKTTKLAGKTSAALTLGPVSTSMAGGYFAVVTSAPNSVTSSVAQLTVYLKPTITITAPKAGQIIFSNVLAAAGTASDNVAVDSVWYQLNNGPWLQASGTTAWTANVTSLQSGANTFRAYSLDSNGDASATNSVKFSYNAFLGQAGTYNGLFYDNNGVAQQSSGFFSLTLQNNGSYTAKLQMGNAKMPFSGSFSLDGSSSATAGALSVMLNLGLAPDADSLSGVVNGSGWQAGLWADRVVFNSKNPPPSQYISSYTLAMPGNDDPAAGPGGYSYSTLTVDAKGVAKFSFSLSDGSSASVPINSTMTKDGRIPLYTPLYKNGNGSLLSWITNDSGLNLSGTLSWIKPAQPADHFYPNGFTNFSQPQGSLYAPQLPGNRSLAMIDGAALFSGANLAGPVTNFFILGTDDKAVSTNGFAFTLMNKNGLLSGSVLFPGKTKATIFKGAALQLSATAFGSFNGTNQTGGFMIYPQP